MKYQAISDLGGAATCNAQGKGKKQETNDELCVICTVRTQTLKACVQVQKTNQQ